MICKYIFKKQLDTDLENGLMAARGKAGDGDS